MEVNRFSIHSSWDSREETPAQLGEQTLRSLDALASINPLFQNWWLLDLLPAAWEMNAEKPEEDLFPLEEARARMTEIVERGVSKTKFREPDPTGGYSIVAFNSILSTRQSVVLQAHGGGGVHPWAGRRNARFKTSDYENPDPAIIAYPAFKAVLTTIAKIWNVKYAQVFSADLAAHWNKPDRRYFELSWITYLAAPIAEQITPPTGALVEKTDDGGLLLIAAEETFDVANPRHMAAAQCIVETLAPLNAEAEQREANRFPPWPPPSQ